MSEPTLKPIFDNFQLGPETLEILKEFGKKSEKIGLQQREVLRDVDCPDLRNAILMGGI